MFFFCDLVLIGFIEGIVVVGMSLDFNLVVLELDLRLFCYHGINIWPLVFFCLLTLVIF